MADSGRKSGADPGSAGPSEEELAARMRALGERLDRRPDTQDSAGAGKPDNSGFASAMRLSTEFVAAILVGAGIGWGIDRFFGVAPWGMIFFLLVGFCAGVMNVLRAANRLADPHGRIGDSVPPSDDEEDD